MMDTHYTFNSPLLPKINVLDIDIENIKEKLTCSISCDFVPLDLAVTLDGVLFNKTYLDTWFIRNNTHPTTRRILSDVDCIPVKNFLAKNYSKLDKDYILKTIQFLNEYDKLPTEEQNPENMSLYFYIPPLLVQTEINPDLSTQATRSPFLFASKELPLMTMLTAYSGMLMSVCTQNAWSGGTFGGALMGLYVMKKVTSRYCCASPTGIMQFFRIGGVLGVAASAGYLGSYVAQWADYYMKTSWSLPYSYVISGGIGAGAFGIISGLIYHVHAHPIPQNPIIAAQEANDWNSLRTRFDNL